MVVRLGRGEVVGLIRGGETLEEGPVVITLPQVRALDDERHQGLDRLGEVRIRLLHLPHLERLCVCLRQTQHVVVGDHVDPVLNRGQHP